MRTAITKPAGWGQITLRLAFQAIDFQWEEWEPIDEVSTTFSGLIMKVVTLQLLLESPPTSEDFTVCHRHSLLLYTVLTTNESA
jgi:hypothetical protein